WGKGPTVLLVHGWGGHAGHLHAIGQALCERGLRVVAYDAPAHGQSGPSRLGARRVTLVEIADALRIVAAGAGPLHGLVAHSGGCTAAALALRGGWTGPRRMALVAPFALPSQAVAPFGRAIGASDAVTARFSARVQVWLGRPWTEFDMTGLPASRTPPPSLVVHDAGDREVPAAHGRALAGAWPGARWLETAGLGHRRLLRDPAVVARVAGFIAGGDRPRRWRPSDARDELDRLFDPHGSTPGRVRPRLPAPPSLPGASLSPVARRRGRGGAARPPRPHAVPREPGPTLARLPRFHPRRLARAAARDRRARRRALHPARHRARLPRQRPGRARGDRLGRVRRGRGGTRRAAAQGDG